MNILIKQKEWQALSRHHHEIKDMHMRDRFAEEGDRFFRYSLQVNELFLDYSRNRITDQTIRLLCDLARAVKLPEKIEALFSGQSINSTEKRPALHTALRNPHHLSLHVNGQNVTDAVLQNKEKMRSFVDSVHTGKWRGVTGKPIKHIINVGIGGSHLGPMMCTHALKNFASCDLDIHFLSSIDDNQLTDVIQKIDPETSLFIISSKTFTTIETLTNAHSLLTWMKHQLGENVLSNHFVAVTASPHHAVKFGIPNDHIFPLWEWVGGRFSVWSSIGLPLMLYIGYEQFTEFLDGAHNIDNHFKNSDFSQNMPVLMAMLSIWNFNFLGANAQAIVPYSHRLRYLIPYLQQADMESNGKRIGLNGHPVDYLTGPVLFGQEGCDGQHAYHQSLHQGQQLIPVDFIMVGNSTHSNQTHQDILIASGLSQAQALMQGKTTEEAFNELLTANYSQQRAHELAPHKVIPGNKPSNIIFLDRITPRNLGALIALYEHKIFVQSVVWNINAFDQWGVELGKQLLPAILQHVQNESTTNNIDSATSGIIQHLKQTRGES